MPDSIFALAVLLVAIVPGFLFLQGYMRGRTQPPVPDIFVVAKAALASLAFVSLVWITPQFLFVESGSTVVDWVRDKKFDQHRDYFLALAWPVFALAFFSGLAIGGAIDWFGRGSSGFRARVGSALEWGGFFRHRTIWASLLDGELEQAGDRIVAIELKDTGGTVIGSFDRRSHTAGDLTELFLSETYRLDATTGSLVPQNRAMYIKGEYVRTISIDSK